MSYLIRSSAAVGFGVAMVLAAGATAPPASARTSGHGVPVALAQQSTVAFANPGGIGSPAVAGDEFSPTYTRDVFEIGTDHRIVGWRLVVSSVTRRDDVGGYATEGVAAVVQGTRETVFTRGSDGAVWYRERIGTGSWGPWRSLGGRIVGRPAAMRVGTLTALAVRGTNGYLYDRERNNLSWSSQWRRVNSQLRGSVALGKGLGAAAFTAYGEGPDGHLWTSTRPGTPGANWTPGASLPDAPAGGRYNSDPAADPYSTVLLVRGNETACWVYNADGNQRWQLLGGLFSSGFAAITEQDPGSSRGTFLYGRGRNGKLYQGWLTAFAHWQPLG
jgi:hypothetical protein